MKILAMKFELFIKSPLQNHPLTPGFQDLCRRLCFNNMEQLLNWPVSQLLKLDGFTYHHYQELWKYLDKNNLVKLLKY
ncbi:hypothetical protein BC349_01465 [Flavihumibacter stibioxidans]|uniref:Uncharacterized protein n=1 Tax=Flavihumibacter stibioxidans TaxID=1834163 RepID=A0ABR7M3N1_9BACT|nr:hypothetical protein [Flavihumibacter stibioxidans]